MKIPSFEMDDDWGYPHDETETSIFCYGHFPLKKRVIRGTTKPVDFFVPTIVMYPKVECSKCKVVPPQF